MSPIDQVGTEQATGQLTTALTFRLTAGFRPVPALQPSRSPALLAVVFTGSSAVVSLIRHPSLEVQLRISLERPDISPRLHLSFISKLFIKTCYFKWTSA